MRHVWKAWVIFCSVATITPQSALAQSETDPLYLQCKSSTATGDNADLQDFILKVGGIYTLDGVKTRVLERWENDEWDWWRWHNVTISPVKIASFIPAGEREITLGLHYGFGVITNHIEFEIDRRDGQFTFMNYLMPPKVTGTCAKIAEPKPPATKF